MAHPKHLVPFLHADNDMEGENRPIKRAKTFVSSDVWQLGVPDESTPLTADQLAKITRGSVPRIIARAMQLNKTCLLAMIAKQTLACNGIAPHDEHSDVVQPLTHDEVCSMLHGQAKACREYNTYTRFFIKLHRDNFSVKSQDVVYGNCPMCLRAMPLGDHCQDCPPSFLLCPHRSVYIYAAASKGEQLNIMDSHAKLVVHGKKPLNPIELSQRFVGLTPKCELDYQSFESNNKYGVPKNLNRNFAIMTSHDFAVPIYRSQKKDAFLASPLEFMRPLGFDDEGIIDALEEMLYPEVTRTHLPEPDRQLMKHCISKYQSGLED